MNIDNLSVPSHIKSFTLVLVQRLGGWLKGSSGNFVCLCPYDYCSYGTDDSIQNQRWYENMLDNRPWNQAVDIEGDQIKFVDEVFENVKKDHRNVAHQQQGDGAATRCLVDLGSRATIQPHTNQQEHSLKNRGYYRNNGFYQAENVSIDFNMMAGNGIEHLVNEKPYKCKYKDHCVQGHVLQLVNAHFSHYVWSDNQESYDNNIDAQLNAAERCVCSRLVIVGIPKYEKHYDHNNSQKNQNGTNNCAT